MSSYFDDLNRELQTLFAEFPGEFTAQTPKAGRFGAFLGAYRELEQRVVREVSLCTGDREFPENLRESIQGIVATRRVFMPETQEVHERNLEYLLSTKLSRLFDSLHSAFHIVASRRVETRFGLLSDDPSGTVKRRDAYDADDSKVSRR